MRPQLRGRDIYGGDLWEAVHLDVNEWLGTGRNHLFVRHYTMEGMIAFFLRYYPDTVDVEYTDGKVYRSIQVENARPFKLSELITEQIGAV